MVYFTNGAFWLVLGQAVLVVIGFVSAIVFANFLPAEEYGNFRYIISLAAIIGSFSLSGLGVAVSGAVARGAEGSLPYAYRAILMWGWVMVVGGALIAGYYFLRGNMLLGVGVLLAGASSPFLVSASLYDSFFEGKKIFSVRALYSVLRNAIPTICVVTAVLLTHNIYVIVCAYFVSNVITSTLLHRRAVRLHVANTSVENGIMKNGIHVSFMNLVGALATNIDRVLIFTMIGGTPLAVFSFAQAPLAYVQTGFQMIKSMVFPKFATRTVAEIKQSAWVKVLQLLIVAILMTIGYWFLAPFFFQTFFPKYSDSIEVTQWLGLMMLTTPVIIYAQALFAHKKHTELHIIKISSLIAKVAALLILIPSYGLIGVVWATLGSKVLEAMMTFFYFEKTSDTHSAT